MSRRHYPINGSTRALLARVGAWAASQPPSRLNPAATGPQVFAAYRAAHDRRQTRPGQGVNH